MNFLNLIFTTHLVEHISTDQHLEGIVDDKCATQLEGLSIAHEEWPQQQHPGEVDGNQSECEQRMLHERKTFGTRIWAYISFNKSITVLTLLRDGLINGTLHCS